MIWFVLILVWVGVSTVVTPILGRLLGTLTRSAPLAPR